jgi:hypothetical protein
VNDELAVARGIWGKDVSERSGIRKYSIFYNLSATGPRGSEPHCHESGRVCLCLPGRGRSVVERIIKNAGGRRRLRDAVVVIVEAVAVVVAVVETAVIAVEPTAVIAVAAVVETAIAVIESTFVAVEPAAVVAVAAVVESTIIAVVEPAIVAVEPVLNFVGGLLTGDSNFGSNNNGIGSPSALRKFLIEVVLRRSLGQQLR